MATGRNGKRTWLPQACNYYILWWALVFSRRSLHWNLKTDKDLFWYGLAHESSSIFHIALSIVRILLNSSTCHFSKTQMTIAAHNLIGLTSWLFVARFVVSVRCNAILKPQSKLCLDIFIIYVIQTISAGLGIFVWN